MAVLQMIGKTIEQILNRSSISDADLLKLQQVCEKARPELAAMDRAMISDGSRTLTLANFDEVFGSPQEKTDRVWRRSITALAFPWEAQRLMLASRMDQVLEVGRLTWRQADERYTNFIGRTHSFHATFLGPEAYYASMGFDRAYEAVWRYRMTMETARVALAIERYRGANHHLPHTLGDLTPDFLDEVPLDYFAATLSPLSYEPQEDGSYVVYSVGRNMKKDTPTDKQGRKRYFDDITTEVAPIAVRTGPQVAEK
jgi:hypothetical protein